MERQTPLARLLARAGERVVRMEPRAAWRAATDGACIIDIRSSDARATDGVIPGSVHIPLTVLPWRLDPGGAWTTPHVRPEQRIVLVCDHGCSSLLAAELLLELGLDATDVVGGIAGWAEAGLPLQPADDVPLEPGERRGMRPPC